MLRVKTVLSHDMRIEMKTNQQNYSKETNKL